MFTFPVAHFGGGGSAGVGIPTPLYYWGMEASGGGENNSGSNSGGDLILTGTLTQTTGQNGNARESNSGANYLEADIGDAISGNVTWSLSFWMKRDTAAGFIAGCHTSNSEAWNLVFIGGNKIRLGPALLESEDTIADTDWHHICLGYDAENDEFWLVIDNGTIATSANSDGADAKDTLILFAKNTTSNDRLDGAIDEVAVWNQDIRGNLTELQSAYWNGAIWVDPS